MKLLLGLVLCLLVAACSTNQTGRVVRSIPNSDGGFDKQVLSEYFESKEKLQKEMLLVHLIVTLGDERLPEGYESNLTWSERKYQDRIDEVEEVYLTNYSDQEITVTEMTLSYYATQRSLITEPLVIPPKSYRKTNALVSTTSVYRAARKRVLKIKTNDSREEIILKEERSQLKN